jgi:hypothetical protein
MAYQDPGKEAERRTQALVKAVNSALDAHYKTAKTKASQRISLSVAHGEGGIKRTPEEQAKSVWEKHSWSLNSAHMTDAAKHVLIKQGNVLTWNMQQIAQQKEAYAVLKQAWNKAMADQDLRNFGGGKDFAYQSNDPLHMELPHSRLNDNDPRVTRALEVYAKATRLEGKSKNMAYELDKGSDFQKNWLKAYDAKLAQAKADEAAAKAALKKAP